MKIRELSVGQSVTIPLVVKLATPRETRARKPYLDLELYDGTDTIMGKYWDWAGKTKPETNAILDVDAQVTEWQGVKQLNISAMRVNSTKHISEFMPSSGYDVADAYKDAYALMSDVKDQVLRALALSALEELQSLFLTVPGAKGIHHAFIGGTLIHCLSVARIAKSIAGCIPQANSDMCTVGGFLHDLGKLFTYAMNGIAIDMTDEGMLYDHLFIGAEFIGNFAIAHIDCDDTYNQAKIEVLRHIVLSHHGEPQYGAVVFPLCMEAHIVHTADSVDASCEQIREASEKAPSNKWTDKIWALANRPHLSYYYIKEIMRGESENEDVD